MARTREWEVTVKEGYGEEATEREVNIRDIAKSLSAEQFGQLVDDFCNNLSSGQKQGERIGAYLQGSHRTLQRTAVLLCLGILKGIQEDVSLQHGVDPRNEKAIVVARQIAVMMERGEFDCGWMV